MRYLTLAVCLAAGCAALAPPPPKPKTAAAPAEGDETGVKGIARMLRESRQARDTKQFEEASRLMHSAEVAVEDASELTRSHPDFEDVEETVKRERISLEAAIEKDRIERRNAAIDDLMRRGEQALKQAGTIYQELRVRVPNEQDVQTYAELVSTLSQLKSDGKQFMDEPRYKVHADDRDQKLAVHEERSQNARWQVEANNSLKEPVDDAYQAVNASSGAHTVPERVAALQQVAAAFSRCSSVIADLKESPQYRDNLLVETRLGPQTLAETRKQCVSRGSQARQEADRIEWLDRAQAVVDRLGVSMAALKAARKASEALAASQAAIEALRACQTDLQGLARHAGHDRTQTFTTLFGVLTQTRLESACAGEETRLTQARPGYAWRAQFEGQVERLGETKQRLDEAAVAADAGARLKAWQAAVGGLKECVDRTDNLAGDAAVQRKITVSTAFGDFNVQGLLKECRTRLAQAEKQLGAATTAASLEQFLATCKGDELTVAQREGVPSRIEPVEGGRMFVYDKKRGKGLTHYGFDNDGKRVDFRVRWLELMSNVVSEIDRVEKAAAAAKTGGEALKASQDALPVLQVCVESVDRAESSPGYDDKAIFNSALGKLTAGRLKRACGAESEKRSRALVGLRWRVRVEELRDRVGAANGELSQAKAADQVEAKLKLLASALGGYTECVERAQALASEQGADKKLKVKTVHGNLDLKGIERACQGQLKTAQAETQRANAARALQEFLSGCKGDEVEVAKRRGVPARVEAAGDGRVFIYEGKGAGKFAFDGSGKRVDAGAKPGKAK